MCKYMYFNQDDFANATPSCNIDDVDSRLLNILDTARQLSGLPFIVNSAFRTRKYEKSKGRSGESYHCKGLAVDIKCTDSVSRKCMIDALCVFPYVSIIIYPTFLHIDVRSFDSDNKPAIITVGSL